MTPRSTRSYHKCIRKWETMCERLGPELDRRSLRPGNLKLNGKGLSKLSSLPRHVISMLFLILWRLQLWIEFPGFLELELGALPFTTPQKHNSQVVVGFGEIGL